MVERRRTPSTIALLLAGATSLAAGCGRAPASPTAARSADAPLPGVQPGEREWFWYDVLAAPQPGESEPARDLLALQPAAARIDALSGLVPGHDPRALTTLMTALRDPQIGVACAAAHELGESGQLAALPRLVKGIGPYPVEYDVPIAVRAAEASALARLGNPAGIPLILMMLAEGTPLQTPNVDLPWTRTTQNAFMQELALPGLRALAGTDFGFHPSAPLPVRQEAVTRARAWWDGQRLALWAAAPLAGDALVARVRLLVAHLGAYQLRQIDGARFTLANLGPAVFPYLQEGLSSADDYVRLHCLEVMERLVDVADGKLRARLASAAAAPLLGDAAGSVAAQAARVAGAAGVADQLVVALQRRREPDVLVAILDALGQTRLPAARDALATFAREAAGKSLLPDVRVALEAAQLAADPARDSSAFLALCASDDAETVYSAQQRLIQLTGSDCGLDPSAPPADRTPALAAARDALARRAGS